MVTKEMNAWKVEKKERKEKGESRVKGEESERERKKGEGGGSEVGFVYAAWDPFTLTGKRSENIKIFIVFQINVKRSEPK